MAAWSGLLRSAGQIFLRNKSIVAIPSLNNGVARSMSGHARTFQIQPSRWHWDKTKDLLHLYVMIGAIPISIVIFLTNIFVGPATLTPIPEDYRPKHWEYYRNPISRFLARYVFTSDQQEYEKYIHFLWTENEVMKCRALERQVDELMKKRIDYQAYYYQPFTNAHYIRKLAQSEKEEREMYGNVFEE